MASNGRVVLITCAAIAGMTGLVAAAPSLYNTFCRVTGFDGTTQRATAEADRVLDRKVTVRFDGTVGQGLPWAFRPEQVSQTLHIGETGLAYFEATNNAGAPVIGTATFNVQPAKAGLYFMKVQCFCFTEQRLEPGQTMSMPVTYYIDPAIVEDDNLDDVREITLSYTFYRDEQAEAKLASAGD